MARALVLNATYEPLSIVSARRAVCLLIAEKAELVEADEAVIREEDQPLLDRFSGVVSNYFPHALITVEGFTDQFGSREYNMKLGQRRADAVRDYLVDMGGLTPERVRQSLAGLFSQIETPATPPQTRGNAPGWPTGRSRTRPERHKVVKKTQNKPEPA